MATKASLVLVILLVLASTAAWAGEAPSQEDPRCQLPTPGLSPEEAPLIVPPLARCVGRFETEGQWHWYRVRAAVGDQFGILATEGPDLDGMRVGVCRVEPDAVVRGSCNRVSAGRVEEAGDWFVVVVPSLRPADYELSVTLRHQDLRGRLLAPHPFVHETPVRGLNGLIGPDLPVPALDGEWVALEPDRTEHEVIFSFGMPDLVVYYYDAAGREIGVCPSTLDVFPCMVPVEATHLLVTDGPPVGWRLLVFRGYWSLDYFR